ncbi:MAG: hydroxymethylbilane synthase [Acetobacteraceae bacterium]|nr:hydroxymethylbilane synthase [Acetobacteraceae bacterium]
MEAVLDRPAERRAREHADRPLPLRIGTRASPLARVQTRLFLGMVGRACPVLRVLKAFEEHPMSTAGDRVQDRPLADIGGKGLFAKEIHEALLDGRIDFAVHSLKDLETELPRGVALACMMPREDSRDALVLGPGCGRPDGADPGDPWGRLPRGALIGSASVRRQAQILHARPDLRVETIRGNVQTRIGKVRAGVVCASFLALAGLRRLGLEAEAGMVLDPDTMVPAAGQGIVGVTCREEDSELLELLQAIEDPETRAVAAAERALLGSLDGSCRTPIGAHARLLADGALRLTGLVARPDGSFLLRRTVVGAPKDASRLGRELGEELRRDSPADILA